MIPTTILTLTLVAQSGAAQPTSTQPQEPSAPQATSTAPSAMPADFEALQGAFANLYGSLQAKGGIAPEDHEVIGSLRDELAAFNNRWPDHQPGLAMELQMSAWIEDHQRVHEVFAHLVELNTDDTRIGFAWAQYFRNINDHGRVEEAFSRLAELHPADPQVRLALAEYVKGRNQYGRAIEVLQGSGIDLTESPQAAMMLSECLFAEQRFAESLDVLLSIPEDVLAANPVLSAEHKRVLPDREQYIDLWLKEQEIRSMEDAADDLPRVELITARGRIVVELFEDHAPNTVANFISLTEAGFYDGTKFHRVLPNFMSQGGDPNTKPGATDRPGTGNPGYRIPDEHDREDARNHFTGSLAMANSGIPNSGGCQFYITHKPPAHLNGKHTVLGRVIEGFEVARLLEEDDLLESVSVLRKRDHEYSPQTLSITPAIQPGLTDTSTTLPTTTQPKNPE